MTFAYSTCSTTQVAPWTYECDETENGCIVTFTCLDQDVVKVYIERVLPESIFAIPCQVLTDLRLLYSLHSEYVDI